MNKKLITNHICLVIDEILKKYKVEQREKIREEIYKEIKEIV